MPLLSTQILWINLLTDSGPALALGVDPPDPDVMKKPPRDPQKGVITRTIWFDIFFVGVIMMLGTLTVMDASLPGGLISLTREAQCRMRKRWRSPHWSFFNSLTPQSRSDELSAFDGLFSNKWLWIAIAVSLALQVGVIHMPFLQAAFGTVPLSPTDWIVCIVVGSTVLWLRELVKLFQKRDSEPVPAGST